MTWAQFSLTAVLALASIGLNIYLLILKHRERFHPYQQQMREYQMQGIQDIVGKLYKYQDSALTCADNIGPSLDTIEKRREYGERTRLVFVDFYEAYQRWYVFLPESVSMAFRKPINLQLYLAGETTIITKAMGFDKLPDSANHSDLLVTIFTGAMKEIRQKVGTEELTKTGVGMF